VAITTSFRNAVSTKNVKGIRIMMKDSFLVDPSFAEFEEMSRLASQVNGLYEEHDGRELVSDKSAWDDNYMDKLMVQVVGNFSHKRIDHLKEVVRKLRPAVSRPQHQTSTASSAASQHSDGYGGSKSKQPYNRPHYSEDVQENSPRRSNRHRGKKITAGVAAGAAVGAVVTTFPIIVGMAIGAVAGGVVATIVTHGEK
jgi:hypothetical protein